MNAARRLAFGEGDAGGKAWAGAALHEVRHGGYGPFWERLVAWRGTLGGAGGAGADNLLNYVAARRGGR